MHVGQVVYLRDMSMQHRLPAELIRWHLADEAIWTLDRITGLSTNMLLSMLYHAGLKQQHYMYIKPAPYSPPSAYILH